MNERIGLLTVNLSADAPDVDVDDVGRGVEVQIPYMLQQHRPRNDLAVVANEVLENLKFARQQLDFPATAGRRSRDEVELEVADAEHRFLDDGRAAPGERLDPRQQLREGKRLDEVIVAARAQATHPVVDLAERTDDQGRRDDPIVPEAPDDGEAVDVRKHAIDRHHRVVGGTSAAQSVVAVGRQIDLVAARREEIHKLLGRFRVVFNDEKAPSPFSHDLASLPIDVRRRSSVRSYHIGTRKLLTYKSETVAFVI